MPAAKEQISSGTWRARVLSGVLLALCAITTSARAADDPAARARQFKNFKDFMDVFAAKLKTEIGSEWAEQFRGFKPRYSDCQLYLKGFKDQEGFAQLQKEWFDTLVFCAQRKDIGQKVTMNLDQAIRLGSSVPEVEAAVNAWWKEHPEPTDDDRKAFQLTATVPRTYYFYYILDCFERVPKEHYADAAPYLAKVLAEMGPCDRRTQEIAERLKKTIGAVPGAALPEVKADLNAPLKTGDLLKMVLESKDPAVHDQVLEKVKPWEERAPGDVSADQTFARTVDALRPSPDGHKRIVAAAVKDLLRADFEQRFSMAGLPLIVAKNADVYRGALSDADLASVAAELDKATGVKLSLCLWVTLLAGDEAKGLDALRNHATSVITRLADWNYLKPLDPKVVGKLEIPASEAVNHVHDLVLLALVPELKADAQALAALRLYVRVKEPQNKGPFTKVWGRGSDKMCANQWAAWSILWRQEPDAAAALKANYAGQQARREAFESRSLEDHAYGHVFAAYRVGSPGEPAKTQIPFAKDLYGRMRIARAYPDSKFTRESVKEYVKDSKAIQRWNGELSRLRFQAKGLTSIPGLKESLPLDQLGAVRDYEDGFALTLSGILAQVFGDKAAALEILLPRMKAVYVRADRKYGDAWGPTVEAVLETDPENAVLDEFDGWLAAADKCNGRDFARWLLKLRRGKDAGPFPAEAFREAWSSDRFADMMFSLGLAEEKAAPYLKDLRSPFALFGQISSGINSMRENRKELGKVLAFLGAIDRIEWHARKLPHLLDSPDVEPMAR